MAEYENPNGGFAKKQDISRDDVRCLRGVCNAFLQATGPQPDTMVNHGRPATNTGVNDKAPWAYEQRSWKLGVIGNFTARCLASHITTRRMAYAGDALADETRYIHIFPEFRCSVYIFLFFLSFFFSILSSCSGSIKTAELMLGISEGPSRIFLKGP